MRTELMAASALVVALAFPAAGQQQEQPQAQQQQQAQQSRCLQQLQEFAGESGRTGLVQPTGVEQPMGFDRPLTMRQQFRQLASAAHIFAMNGREDECQTVVSGMREMYKQRAEGQQQAAGQVEPELAQAQPVGQVQGPIRIDNVIGSDVQNAQGEDLGDIEDVVLGPDGNIQYALISRGGFFGIGGERVPVRWQDLSVTADYDTFVLNVPESVVENAPAIESEEQLAQTQWQQQADAYWDQNVGQQQQPQQEPPPEQRQ